MTPDRAFEQHYSQLVSIINKIIPYFSDYTTLFSMVSSSEVFIFIFMCLSNVGEIFTIC